MSSLMFLTRDAETAVSGRERARFGGVLDHLAWRTIERDLDPSEIAGPSVLRAAVDLPTWVTNGHGAEFARMAKLLICGTGADRVNLPGRANVATVLEVHLNTILANYSDPVAFASRLYAQAECNAWIDGADRKWAADLIEQGIKTSYPPEIAAGSEQTASKLFDQDASVNGTYAGWAGVVEMLRAGDGIVVIASSITDGFPGQIWAAREGELRDEFRTWWKQASPDERWDRSEEGLREDTALNCPVLRIAPDTLHARLFGRDRGINPTWYGVATAWRNA
jgi:hypothetical protein